jgi:hypothetical protein
VKKIETMGKPIFHKKFTTAVIRLGGFAFDVPRVGSLYGFPVHL